MKLFQKEVTLAVTVTLLCGFAALARDHNAFNGTWTLVPARSEISGEPVLESGTVTISDHEGNTNVTRNFAYKGAGQTYFYSDSVGNEHGATIHEGKDLKSKTTWDRDTLRITTTTSSGVTVETYTIGDDGMMVANVARPGAAALTLRFERK